MHRRALTQVEAPADIDLIVILAVNHLPPLTLNSHSEAP